MIFYDSGYPYEVEAEKKGEVLVKAIQEKDVAAIEELFSTYAKNHIKDLDGAEWTIYRDNPDMCLILEQI